MTSTPRKASTPYQLWREEHLKQELAQSLERRGSPAPAARKHPPQSLETGDARKHPPTRLYIEEEPGKRVETFQRWRQQQSGRLDQVRDEEETRTPDGSNVLDTRLAAGILVGSPDTPDTRHLSELEREIEAVQRTETGSTPAPMAAAGDDTPPATVKSRKKDKRSSISSILNVFTRKKSSAPTPPPKRKKKSSLFTMMEKEGGGASGSVLDPSAQQKIIENPEAERAKSPYQLWRSFRESRDSPGPSYYNVPPATSDPLKHSVPTIRTPTPDPDYDNLSYKSSASPRAPRESPRAPREHNTSFDDASSDTSFEDCGRHTPRSNASEYGRNIPRYQPMPNLIMGYGRGGGGGGGVSPAHSEASLGAKRSPSTDSFFGKNGASVGQGPGSSSQIWYQKYKHSSFSHPNQSSFGEPLYGAFDGRISKFRGKQSPIDT